MTTATKARGIGASTRPLPRWPGRVVVALAGITAVLILGHRLVPDVAGAGSLIDTVSPWLGLAVPPLAVAAILLRSRPAGLAVLAPLVVWLIAFGTAWLPAGGGSIDIRVASQNVRANNADPAATVRAVAATGADIIGLQEVTDQAASEIQATLQGRYPYHVSESTVELWSRYKISDFTGVDLGLSWTRALRAEVASPKGTLTVYVVHLASARAGATATRDSTMTALVDRVKADTASRIVVIGDLNTASTDRILGPLTDLLHDTQQAAGVGFGFTWPSGFPLTRPDHVLYRGLHASTAGVIKTPGSDHRAITAGLRF